MKRTFVAAIIVTNLITASLMGGWRASAATSDERPQQYYTLARTYARQVFDGIKGLKGLQAEWNAGGYGSNLPAGAGSNAGVNRTQLGAVIFDTADALDAVLTANSGAHTANLQPLF